VEIVPYGLAILGMLFLLMNGGRRWRIWLGCFLIAGAALSDVLASLR
jgi:uncharacterized membrane protein YecN with MAPEG domain